MDVVMGCIEAHAYYLKVSYKSFLVSRKRIKMIASVDSASPQIVLRHVVWKPVIPFIYAVSFS